MTDFTFKKEERLKSRKVIGRLFKEGTSFGVYPLRLFWLEVEEELAVPVQFTLSVPKRAFPKAAHRNRLRRQVREAWRLNKYWLYQKLENEPRRFAFMVIYTGKEPLPYKSIEGAMRRMSGRFVKNLGYKKRSTNR